jgi:hypothetical protein
VNLGALGAQLGDGFVDGGATDVGDHDFAAGFANTLAWPKPAPDAPPVMNATCRHSQS